MGERDLKILMRTIDAHSDEEFLTKLRQRLIQANLLPEAIKVSKRLILRVPYEDKEAKSFSWSDLATLLIHAERFDEAFDAAEMALALYVRNDEAWEHKGICHLARNELAEASDCYLHAIALCKNDDSRRGFLFLGYSKVHKLAGNDAAEAECLRKAETILTRQGLPLP